MRTSLSLSHSRAPTLPLSLSLSLSFSRPFQHPPRSLSRFHSLSFSLSLGVFLTVSLLLSLSTRCPLLPSTDPVPLHAQSLPLCTVFHGRRRSLLHERSLTQSSQPGPFSSRVPLVHTQPCGISTVCTVLFRALFLSLPTRERTSASRPRYAPLHTPCTQLRE